jgi:hypothetical protein
VCREERDRGGMTIVVVVVVAARVLRV